MTDNIITYSDWKDEYWHDLYNMFNIIHKKYEGNSDNDWDKFNRFCLFVFKKDNYIE
jgi:hypothetical protein